jgi:hypothetical protein
MPVDLALSLLNQKGTGLLKIPINQIIEAAHLCILPGKADISSTFPITSNYSS